MESSKPSGSLVDHFARLAPLAAEERNAAVEHLAAEAPALARELRDLLDHHDQASGFLQGDDPATGGLPSGARPTSIGGFKILGELGWGGTGIVYLAEQDRPRRRVALKVLRWDRHDPLTVKRFEREAETLGALEHPNLARVYAAGVDTVNGVEVPWFAMECVEGEPLDRALAGADWTRIAAAVADAADGVQVAHAAGVVHRDLKPSNVLMTADGRAVVLDFGIAAISEGARTTLLTHVGHIVGTLATMSPEQADGRTEQVDARSDVYALGVMLYELLAGVPPIDVAGVDAATAIARIARSSPRRLRRIAPKVPADLDTLVHAALSKEQEFRPATAGDLADDLRRVIERMPIRARRATRRYRMLALARRHRTLFGAVATVLLLLTIALGVTLSTLREVRALNREVAVEQALDHALVLETEARTLWPTSADMIPSFDAWLDEAEVVRAQLSGLLQELRPSGRAADEFPSRGRPPERVAFDLFDPERTHGGYNDVFQRRAEAADRRRETVEAIHSQWLTTIGRIEASPHYSGLVIEPQEGLVPLGPDPDSGLEEFAVWGRAGACPTRDPSSGAIDFSGGSTVVLVLVPGGSFWFGRQRDDPDGPNYDPKAQGHEWMGARSQLSLDPFFASKFETTQGQFERVMGFNTSYWRPGEGHLDCIVTLRHPVESVRQDEARLFAERIGLALPTEVQLEYVMRGGTRTAYWFGDSLDEGVGRAAIHQLNRPTPYVDDEGRPAVMPTSGLHAPTGLFEPNPFGVFDAAGNVMEWCRDEFWSDLTAGEFTASDGEFIHPDGVDSDGAHISVRGGYSPGGAVARSGARNELLFREAARHVGFRTVRPLEGAWSRTGPHGR